ncbi:MAG TPA: hypothetical protein VG013_02780 [Gemmataceae bacterium]|jgi:hypothetical protein|nr:hypothetical protein [Gemmataceae bacterium]
MSDGSPRPYYDDPDDYLIRWQNKWGDDSRWDTILRACKWQPEHSEALRGREDLHPP